MVLRLPFVSELWVPLTILLFAASIGISQTADDSGKADDSGGASNVTSKWNKTGIPQIDYLTDPNLPRELNGYNLSDYPFFNRVPTNISFKCDGLKDGFYASIEHKCQLYHHCLFGTRYDFLCANYTAFDQRTFICQFVSEVDCPNSALFFHRNDALYVTKSSTTEAPVRSRDRGSRGRRPIRPALPPPSQKNDDPVESAPESGTGSSKSLSSNGTKKQKYVEPEDDYYDEPYEEERERPRRPYRRRPWRKRPTRPIYYYPPYDYYDDYDYEEPVRRPYARRHQDRERGGRLDAETDEDPPPRKLGKRRDKERRKQVVDEDYPVDEDSSPKSAAAAAPSSKSATTTSTSTIEPAVFDPVVLVKNRDDLFTMSRAPPKIKPPVPLRERTKFHQMQGRIPPEPSTTTTTEAPAPQPSKRRIPTAKPAENEPFDQSYYDEDYEQAQAPAKKSSKYLPFPTTAPTTTTSTTTTTTTTSTSPAPIYEYEYEEYEEEQPQIKFEPTTTTTTTTTTTPRPNSSSRRGRNNRKRQEDQGQGIFPTAADATQENRIALSSTPGVKPFDINDGIDTTIKNPAFRTPFGSRPRSSFFNKGAFATTASTPSPTPATTTTTTTPKPEIISTYRPKDYRSYVPQRAFIETTTPNSRTSSRFWQRQQPKATPVAVTTTTTTTTAPEAADYVYYDDSVTLSRYGQRSASTYPQYPQTAPEYVADSPEQPEVSEEAPTAPPAPDQPLINNYQPQPEAPTSYRNSPGSSSSRYQVPRGVEQTNYVTPFSTAPSLPKTTVASYSQYQQQQQQQPHQQRPQSNLQQSQQSQNQPEFISLLPEDEEASYYSQRDNNDPGSSHMMSMISPTAQSLQSQPLPQNRFRNQVTRMFTSPQELYPVYAPAPQYIKSVRPRQVYPTMFLPYGTY